MQGEEQDAAEPEGEGVRRRAGEDVVGRRLQHVAGERVADGQHVAVEVHRRLRAAGGAGGEGEHRDVVAGGEDVVEGRGLGGDPLGPGVVAEASVGTPSGSTASRNRWSTSAASRWAISWMVCSSPVRSRGIVVTRTAPALSTPNQAADSHWLLGPRSRTRLPGTIPRSSTRTCAIRFAAASSSSYDQVGRPGWWRHGRSPPWRAITSSSRAVAALRRSGYWSSGSVKTSSGHWSSGGRWSRQNVSTWAEGSSSMADNVCPVRDDGQECAICGMCGAPWASLGRAVTGVAWREVSGEGASRMWFVRRRRRVLVRPLRVLVQSRHLFRHCLRAARPRAGRDAPRRCRALQRHEGPHPTTGLATTALRSASRRSPWSARRSRPTRTTRSRADVRRGPSRRPGRGRTPPR